MKTKLISTSLSLLLLLHTVLLFAACGAESIATGFRIGFAASKPFVSSLVDSDTLSPELVDKALDDIDDGIAAAAKAESCVKAAQSSASKAARRFANSKCYFQVAQDLRGILARHNLDQHPQLNRPFRIVSSAIEAFEQYYAAVNTGPEVTGPDGGIIRTGADGVSGADADKELERSMKALKKEFDQLKAPKK